MKLQKEFYKGILEQNPVLKLLLGMCPTLAVTTSAINGLTMGLAVIFVLTFSALIVSLIRKLVPHEIRIATFTVIIATLVTIADLFLKAHFPALSKALGPYVPLIVVNCIILGRHEAFSSRNPPHYALADALGMGIGFSFALLILSSFRELLGNGTIFGYKILGDWFEPMVAMILPVGAFIGLGILVGIMNAIQNK